MRLCLLLDVDTESLLLRFRLDEHTDGGGIEFKCWLELGHKSFLNNPIANIYLIKFTDNNHFKNYYSKIRGILNNNAHTYRELSANCRTSLVRLNIRSPWWKWYALANNTSFYSPGYNDITERRIRYITDSQQSN